MKKYRVDLYVNDQYISTDFLYAEDEFDAEKQADKSLIVEYEIFEDE